MFPQGPQDLVNVNAMIQTRGIICMTIFGPAAENRDIRTYTNSGPRSACASTQSGQDLRSSPTQYKNRVEELGLIAKVLTRHVKIGRGFAICICSKGLSVSGWPI